MFNSERLIEDFINSNHVPQTVICDKELMKDFTNRATNTLKWIEATDCAASASNFDATIITYHILKAICEAYIVGYDRQDASSYDEGYDEGRKDGYNEGWNDGHDEGYEKGYSNAIMR